MKPSEIADLGCEARLRFEASAMYRAVDGGHTEGTFHLINWQDKPHRVLYHAVKLMDQAANEIAAQAEALKIATDALDALIYALDRSAPVDMMKDIVSAGDKSRLALARIKEINQ